MRIQPFGDSAILITLEEVISEEVNQKVISLYQSFKDHDGIKYQTPGYNSLTIGYDPKLWKFVTLSALAHQLIEALPEHHITTEKKIYSIPVCYDKPFDLDSEEVCAQIGITKTELISAHTEQVFRVYMLGFVAGFAYMGSMPPHLACKRKATPRAMVPKGAVGIAGIQTGIYPTQAPGGWQIIGQTPLDMFNPELKDLSLLQPGDYVKFRPIGEAEFKIIRLQIETSVFEMEEAHV